MSDLSGRELDAAVCGLMEARPEKSPMDFQPWRSESPAGWWTADASYLEPEQACWLPQSVSTDIAWAMRAYGVMHERGWCITRVRHSGRGCGVEMWCDHLRARAFVEPVGREPGAVLAEAICRAIVEAGGE